MQAVRNQGKKNADRVQRILNLYQNIRVRIRELTRTQYFVEIVDLLFNKPIFRASDLQVKTQIPKQTLMPILKQLIKAEILVVIKQAKGRSPAVMKFPELLAITKS